MLHDLEEGLLEQLELDDGEGPEPEEPVDWLVPVVGYEGGAMEEVPARLPERGDALREHQPLLTSMVLRKASSSSSEVVWTSRQASATRLRHFELHRV